MSERASARARWVALGCLALLGGSALGQLLWGDLAIEPGQALTALLARLGGGAHADPLVDGAIWQVRLPRLLVAAIVGCALAVAGALMQGLFRNPLASPGIVGTSTGALLGAVIAMSWRLHLRTPYAAPLCAIFGALISLLVILGIARREGGTPTATLLLAGVALQAFLGALLGGLMALSWEVDWQVARAIAQWQVGGVSERGWGHVGIALPGVIAGLGLAWTLAAELDLLLEGEEVAASLGVSVERSKLLSLMACALLVGSAVAVAGAVAFVGLVVPHILRLLAGPAHGRLLPLCALGGAAFLVAADLVARSAAAPRELYLGVITAFVGAPFFLGLLLTRRSEFDL